MIVVKHRYFSENYDMYIDGKIIVLLFVGIYYHSYLSHIITRHHLCNHLNGYKRSEYLTKNNANLANKVVKLARIY